jgi:hypothetical protein
MHIGHTRLESRKHQFLKKLNTMPISPNSLSVKEWEIMTQQVSPQWIPKYRRCNIYSHSCTQMGGISLSDMQEFDQAMG